MPAVTLNNSAARFCVVPIWWRADVELAGVGAAIRQKQLGQGGKRPS